VDLAAAVDVVSTVITSAAIVAGGLWAYFKFARGRTFAYRAALDIEMTKVGPERAPAIHIHVLLRNEGLSRIPLNPKMKAVRLWWARPYARGGIEKEEWERVHTARLFADHDWLEGQETVSDELLYHLPATSHAHDRPVAVQAEVMVGARASGLRRRMVRWHCRRILPISPTPATPTSQL
jgi:hypothetical protein